MGRIERSHLKRKGSSMIEEIGLILKVGSLAVSLGLDATQFLIKAYAVYSGTALSDEERKVLLNQEKAFRDELQAPLED